MLAKREYCTDNYDMSKEGIILTGFMGMGKSTIGPSVAEKLQVNYFDTDEWLETLQGIDIPELVKTNMPEFRRIEAEALKNILDKEPGVISTGGGIVSTEVGRSALLASSASVVWLRAPFEVAADRVIGDSGRERPLFSNVESARALFDERQQWYEDTATHIVDASQPKEQVVEAVMLAVAD